MNAESNFSDRQVTSWEGLYALDKHWQSDLDFFKDEIHFLNDLISKYFIWITERENYATVNHLSNDLIDLEADRNKIAVKLRDQLNNLGRMVEDTYNEPEENLKRIQGELDQEFSAFVKRFRKLKKSIFKVSEHVIESEKLEHMLKP